MTSSLADGFVQVAPDSSGKKIDNTEVTRSDTGVVVERQRIEVRDDNDETLSTASIVEQLKQTNELLFQIYTCLAQKFPETSI
jgi:hypothetical protein